MNQTESDWLYEISPQKKLIELNFREIWRYKDLLFLFVKRDIVTVYKQTILGPIWYLIQPLFTSVIFTIVFNGIASIPTNGIPSFLFNLTGITAWNYFSQCLNSTSNTFRANSGIFGKVYFPRIIMPLSKVLSNLLKFGIQLLILSCFYIYYLIRGYDLAPNSGLVLLPVYLLTMALMGLGAGMLISAFTTKYRDLTILVGFATSLLLYISAVPYPIQEAQSKLPDYFWIVEINPLSYLIEGFRYMILDTGIFNWFSFLYPLAFSIILFLIGMIFFNKTERNFIDTV